MTRFSMQLLPLARSREPQKRQKNTPLLLRPKPHVPGVAPVIHRLLFGFEGCSGPVSGPGPSNMAALGIERKRLSAANLREI